MRGPAIRFEGRTIAAKVQGPHEPPYMVRISFDPFSREQWDGVWVEVRDRGALASSIPSGDLPMEIQTAFSKVKLRFMPERYVDLHLECACPDWLKPCKHLVAVWLKFARDFDHDPFLVFELRGLKRDELLAILRNRQRAAVPEPEEADAEEEFPEVAVPMKLAALPADPEAFWSAPALPAASPESPGRRIEQVPGALLLPSSRRTKFTPERRKVLCEPCSVCCPICFRRKLYRSRSGSASNSASR